MSRQVEFVRCPVCGEPDMRREKCSEGGVINCVNLACGSDGGENVSALVASGAIGGPKPNCCQACSDGAVPIYPLQLTITGEGWSSTTRRMWICADCQHRLAFEDDFFFHH